MAFASPADEAAFEAFFADRAAGRRLFLDLAQAVLTGPGAVTATQVRACLLRRTRFLWCPKAHADGHVFLRFLLPYTLESPRLERTREVGGRWAYRVKIDRLDDEVLGWFRAAYEADA